jgi:hypothetical protein
VKYVLEDTNSRYPASEEIFWCTRSMVQHHCIFMRSMIAFLGVIGHDLR